jgi:hypothetical protein
MKLLGFFLFEQPWFGATVLAAFACVILSFMVDSAYGDRKKGRNRNLIIGSIFFGLLTLFFLYKAYQTSTGRPG